MFLYLFLVTLVLISHDIIKSELSQMGERNKWEADVIYIYIDKIIPTEHTCLKRKKIILIKLCSTFYIVCLKSRLRAQNNFY